MKDILHNLYIKKNVFQYKLIHMKHRNIKKIPIKYQLMYSG